MTPLEHRILEYLREHPRASDTIEGISHWWVYGDAITDTQEQIQEALDHLINLGVLFARVDSSGRAHYRLSQDHN